MQRVAQTNQPRPIKAGADLRALLCLLAPDNSTAAAHLNGPPLMSAGGVPRFDMTAGCLNQFGANAPLSFNPSGDDLGGGFVDAKLFL